MVNVPTRKHLPIDQTAVFDHQWVFNQMKESTKDFVLCKMNSNLQKLTSILMITQMRPLLQEPVWFFTKEKDCRCNVPYTVQQSKFNYTKNKQIWEIAEGFISTIREKWNNRNGGVQEKQTPTQVLKFVDYKNTELRGNFKKESL